MHKFRIDKARLFIVRHAEAQKNLEKMHGGGTQDLTERGKIKLRHSISELEPSIQGRKVFVFHQKEGRSEETAKIIAKELDLEIKRTKEIYGVGLGIIAGLNEDELKEQYPEVSAILERWKNDGAKLDDYPDIPGREHMVDFANRIRKGLMEILKPDTDTILVGTTSTINMLNHLMEKDGSFIHEDYDFISFPFSGINGWQIYKDKPPKKVFSNF